MPSKDYFETILEGLKECYGGEYSEELLEYLTGVVFAADTFTVDCAIKESDQGVSNSQLSTLTGLDYESVVTAVNWLVQHKVIQQDCHSVCAGHQIDNPEAVFFTVNSPCAHKLVSFIIEHIKK